MYRGKKLIRILAFVTMAACITACMDKVEEYGSITGFVSDANSGEPLRNVDVTLTPMGLSTVSGSDGHFEFVDLDANQYTIQASKSGYQTNTKIVQVRNGKVTNGNIMLTPSYSEMSLSVQRIDFGESETVQYFQIKNNAANGSISWSISLLSSAEWLTVSPLSGNTGAGQQSMVTLTVDRTHVTNSTTVILKVTNTTSGSEITIPVSVGYNTNVLNVSPSTIDFGTSAVSKSLMLSNVGNNSISYQIDYNCAWLSVSPSSGTLSPGASQTINLALNRSVLNGQGSTYVQIRNVNDGSITNVLVTANSSGGGNDAIVVPGGLIAYYTFDNSNCDDMTENGIHASGVNTPSFPSDGSTGHYLMLNAMQGQYMNIPYNLFNGLSTFSVSFWIKDFGPGCIFAAQNSNSNNYYYDVPYFSANQNGKFFINGGDYSNARIQFSYNYQNQGIQSGNWHHIVITLFSGTVKLYVDGSLVDQASMYYHVASNNNCSKIVFGSNKTGEGYTVSNNMKLDNIRFYNRAITNIEVQTIYNNEL